LEIKWLKKFSSSSLTLKRYYAERRQNMFTQHTTTIVLRWWLSDICTLSASQLCVYYLLFFIIALLTLATGWQQIVCRWIPPRPSCCGLAQNTSRCWVVVLLPYSSAQILWQPAIMYEYSGWPISSDLALEKHVSKTCAACFYWLHQLCLIRRSLDEESTSTLVHAFVTSWIDYCNAIYAGAPKTISDKLQQVLSSTARVVSDTKKFDCFLSTLLHDKLHWLDVPERITFKLGLMTYRSLHGPTVQHLDTSPSTPPQPLKSPLDIDYVLHTDTSLLYRTVDSTCMAIWLFQSLVRRSGTHCQMNSQEIQHVTLTVWYSSSKQSCSVNTSVTTALDVNLTICTL